MPKNYIDEKLQVYFRKYVGMMEIDNSFKPLIVDILLRRAYEYQLNPADIRQDMTSLLHNLRAIKIEELDGGYEKAAGVYDPDTKEVIINKNYLKEAKTNPRDPILYEILTHEVYHALSMDEYGNDRLASKNSYTDESNTSLEEVIVEKAADRCVYPRKDDTAPYYHQNKLGYNYITFITDAIAATYGVSERDFLKNAIMGRNRMIDFLATSANEPTYRTRTFLDSIECNFARLHHTLYPPMSKSKSEGIRHDTRQKMRTIKESLSGIYCLCEGKFLERIENSDIEGPRMAKRFVNEIGFNHNRLTYIMGGTLEKYSRRFDRDDIFDDVIFDVNMTRNRTINRINDLQQVADAMITMPYKAGKVLFYEAKMGNLADYNILQLSQLGITLRAEKIFSEDDTVVDSYYATDFSEDDWDNREITNSMRKACSRAVRADTFGNVMKRVFSTFNRLYRTSEAKALLPEFITDENISLADIKSKIGRVDEKHLNLGIDTSRRNETIKLTNETVGKNLEISNSEQEISEEK